MKFVSTIAAAAVLCATASTAATFTDRAAFLAAGGTFTEHTDIAADFTITSGGGGASPFLSTGTYTDVFGRNPFVVISGEENFNAIVTFATSVFAFGMDIYEPTSTARFNGCNVSQCQESTFEISFLDGMTTLDTISISPDNNTLDFIGYSNGTGFDQIQVRETVGSNDNEMFGNFVTSSSPLSAVPLPTGLPFLGAGLLGLFALVRRRPKAS